MKPTLIGYLLGGLAGAHLAGAQGTFQNLDFEAARLVFESDRVIATTNALPGWSVFSGTSRLERVPYGIGGFVPAVSLVSQTNFGSLSGFFSVVLGGGGSIIQTESLPSDARSLLFRTEIGGGPFTVSLGGQELFYASLLSESDYILYGADISSFAGQTAALNFSAGPIGHVMIDDIEFSSQPIPEPATVALFVLAGGAIVCSHQCRKPRPAKRRWS